jgi:hypothetical protein
MMKILPCQRTQLGDVSMPDSFKIIDSKKFMWDGETYEGMDQAKAAEENYKKEKFETMIIEEEGKPLVYTRREVTEIVLEGEPPPA